METQNKSKRILWVAIAILIFVGLGFLTNHYKVEIRKVFGTAAVLDWWGSRAVSKGWTIAGYAWGENVGWIDFNPTNGDTYVSDNALYGYAFGENTGWISLNCYDNNSCLDVDYKILNDGEGNLTGYAWGENVGWIHFNPTNGGVTITSDGTFSGNAWGENIGWVVFETNGNASTTWRAQSSRTQCDNGLDDDGDGDIDYPDDSQCTSLTDNKEAMNASRSSDTSGVGGSEEDVSLTDDSSDTALTDDTSVEAPASTPVPPVTSAPTTGPAGTEPTTPAPTGQISTDKFLKDLSLGSVGSDVRDLQVYLNNNGFTLSETGAGSPGNETENFGVKTENALIRYQEAFVSEILAPFGLTTGTGIFGSYTRAHVNARLAK